MALAAHLPTSPPARLPTRGVDDLMIAFSLAAAQVSSGLGAKAGGLRRK